MDLVGLQRQFYRVAKLDLTTGLAADFPFNGNANDESGNGNHGTVTDAVLTADRLGNPNSAYSFNGTSSVITIPDSLSLRIPGDLTVVCWVKLFGLSGNTRFVGKGEDCYRNYGVWADASSSWLFQQFPPAGGCVECQENTLATSPAVATGNWYQVVGVRNGNQSRLYLNAQLLADADNQSQNCAPSTYTGPEPLLIGAPGYVSPPQNLQFVNGAIDDVRIYNRALTEAEIQYLYSH